MRRLAPYQTGLWLAEYLNSRCQLCSIYASSTFLSKHKTRLNHSNSRLLCEHCHDSLVWLPAPFTVDIVVGATLSIQAATYYEYPIRQAFRAFKYHEDMTKLPLLVHILRQLPRPIGCHGHNSVIVPMPTTNSRLRKRGFDPVTILSAYLAKHWQIPLWHGVARIDNTLSQQGLTRSERLSNLNNAFALTEQLSAKSLLLFDDVATTGASLQALAQALYFNGATNKPPEIIAYALAHGSS